MFLFNNKAVNNYIDDLGSYMDISKRILKSSVVHFFNYCLTVVITFFLTPLMINKLGDFNYGLWILVNTIVGYLSFSEFGISSAIQNHLSVFIGKKDLDNYSRIFSNGVFLYFLICLFSIILLIIVSFFIYFFGFHLIEEKESFMMILLILGINISLNFIFFPYNSVISSHIRQDILAWASIYQNFTYAIFVFVVINTEPNLILLALLTLLVNLSTNFIIFIAAKKIAPYLKFEKKYIERKKIEELLKYSGKTFLAQIGDVLRFKLDEIVIGTFISVSKVTHYSIANRLVSTSNNLLLNVLGVLNPLFARQFGEQNQEKIRTTFILSIKVTVFFSSIIYAFLFILGKPFIILWLGSLYLDSFVPLLLLATAFFIARIQSPSVSILYATNMHHYYAYMNFGEGFINLFLSILFVLFFKMGITGVALGTLISIIITKLLIQPFIICKIVEIKIKDYFFLISKLLLTIIVYFIPYFISFLGITNYLNLLLMGLLICCISCFQIILIFNKYERAYFKNIIKNCLH